MSPNRYGRDRARRGGRGGGGGADAAAAAAGGGWRAGAKPLGWDARRRRELGALQSRASAVAAEYAVHAERNRTLREREVVLTSLEAFLRQRLVAIGEGGEGGGGGDSGGGEAADVDAAAAAAAADADATAPPPPPPLAPFKLEPPPPQDGAAGGPADASAAAAAAAAAGSPPPSHPHPAKPGTPRSSPPLRPSPTAATAVRAAAAPAAAAPSAEPPPGTPLLALVARGAPSGGGPPRRAEVQALSVPAFVSLVRRVAERGALVLRMLGEEGADGGGGGVGSTSGGGAPAPPAWGALSRGEAERRLAADVGKLIRADFALSLHFPERIWRVKTIDLETLRPFWRPQRPLRRPRAPSAGGEGEDSEGSGERACSDDADDAANADVDYAGQDGEDEDEDDPAALDAAAGRAERHLERPARLVLRHMPRGRAESVAAALRVALPRLNAALRALRADRARANAALDAALRAGDLGPALAALAGVEAANLTFSNAQWQFGHAAAASQGVLDVARVFASTWPLYPSAAVLSEAMTRLTDARQARVGRVPSRGGGGGGGEEEEDYEGADDDEGAPAPPLP